MKIRRQILWRVYLAFGLICLFSVAIVVQSFRIQNVQGKYWRNLADSLTTAYRTIEPTRGNIRSEDDRLLATSLPFFEVRLDLKSEALSDEIFYDQLDSLCYKLEAILGKKTFYEYRDWLLSNRDRGNRYLLIKRKVNYPELQDMKTWPLFKFGKYKGGFISIQRNKRITPFRMLAHRTIGYVREDVQPVGLEGAFDNVLGGTPGKRLMQKLAGGTWIPINDANEIEPVRGKDILVTLDVNIQDVAESALLKALKLHRADHGCVVVMEVKTGKIKAIANLGSIGEGQYWEKYNYAVGEGSEPGSTFKLASMLALLKDGAVKLTDSVDLEKGKIKYYDKIIRDSQEHDLRMVTVQRAFEISSNAGISKLVQTEYGDRPERFIKHLRELGLDEKVNIEIQGESSPFIMTPENKDWSGVSLAFMSIGYEVKLTPLQTLALFNAVANDGRYIQPYLVSAIMEDDRVTRSMIPARDSRRIASGDVLKDIRIMLEGVVERGTAANIRSSEYKIAGKTGTAQIADRKHGYKKVYQSSFAGYFPAEDPIYSCIVVVVAPSSGAYYGSVVAAPVFKEISDKIYANSLGIYRAWSDSISGEIPYAKVGRLDDIRTVFAGLDIPYEVAEPPEESAQESTEWVVSIKENEKIRLKERILVKGLVPEVLGMGLKDALYLLGNLGLEVKVEGRGRVRKQSLKVGTRARKGDIIHIKLS